MELSASNTQLAAVVALAVVSVDIIRRLIRDRIERKGCPLPPGPMPLPFLGSALSVNIRDPYKTYTEWQKKYGDIIYVRLLGTDVVVLNSASIATELLEKRTYSDRPFIATLKPYGQDVTFGFRPYDDHLKMCRKIFHQTFRPDAVASFHPMLLRKARQLALIVMDDPNDYAAHYANFISSSAMCSIYGYDPVPQHDSLVKITYDFLDASLPELMPQKAVLHEFFPFLLHIPDWLPGSWIKHEARRARGLSANMVEKVFQYPERHAESEEAVGTSMISNHVTLMETLDESNRPKHKQALKDSAVTAFVASLETSTAVLMSFTLAMVRHPHVWKRAQVYIDSIVGTERLPDFGDRQALPYIDAIMRETLRWIPPAFIGIPHATATSDVYNGFYIPKGATVLGNIWAMTRDEGRYPDPESFVPERFLDAKGDLTDDAMEYAFGFGRRICPGKQSALVARIPIIDAWTGRYSADASLWIAMATMLATFDFDRAKDVNGRVFEFEVKYMYGMARRMLTFPCSITPRTHITEDFIEQVVD